MTTARQSDAGPPAGRLAARGYSLRRFKPDYGGHSWRAFPRGAHWAGSANSPGALLSRIRLLRRAVRGFTSVNSSRSPFSTGLKLFKKFISLFLTQSLGEPYERFIDFRANSRNGGPARSRTTVFCSYTSLTPESINGGSALVFTNTLCWPTGQINGSENQRLHDDHEDNQGVFQDHGRSIQGSGNV